MVGLIPLYACLTLEQRTLEKLPNFNKRFTWFMEHTPELADQILVAHDCDVTQPGLWVNLIAFAVLRNMFLHSKNNPHNASYIPSASCKFHLCICIIHELYQLLRLLLTWAQKVKVGICYRFPQKSVFAVYWKFFLMKMNFYLLLVCRKNSRFVIVWTFYRH